MTTTVFSRKKNTVKCLNLERIHCDLKEYLSRAAFFSCGGFGVYPISHVTKDFRNALLSGSTYQKLFSI